MHTPQDYKVKLLAINEQLRCDLTNLINDCFDGCYMREHTDPIIKLSNIIGTPVVYEIKTGGSGKIFYKSGLWNGKRVSSSSDTYYELRDSELFEVYEILYKLVYSEENY